MSRFFRYGLTLLGIASCIFIYSIQNQNATAAVAGCTDPVATNYDPSATIDDGSCSYPPPPPPPPVLGCMNPAASNYNPAATVDDGSCIIAPPPPPPVLGCMNPAATNYNPSATSDDGSCIVAPPPPPVISGCTNSGATNYNSGATVDDGSCIMPTPSPAPAGGGGGGGGSSAGPTTIITSTTMVLTNSGKIEPNVKIVEKPCEITTYTGYISQVFLATNTGETIRKRSPIDFTKMEGACEGKNITPKVIKYPFNSFVARGDEWKTNRFPEDFYAYLTQNGGGATVNQTKYIFTYSGKTLNNTDISTKTTKSKKNAQTIKKTNGNKEIILGGDPIENLKSFHEITFKNPIRIYCTNIKEYSSKFPILDSYFKEHCKDIVDSNVKKEEVIPCTVTQFSGSLLRWYHGNAGTKVQMKFTVDYTDKTGNCTGDETPKIIRKVACLNTKELMDYSSGVINYFNELGCGSKIHQDSYYFKANDELTAYIYIGSSDISKELEKTPFAKLETHEIKLTCETARNRLEEFPVLEKLYKAKCKERKNENEATEPTSSGVTQSGSTASGSTASGSTASDSTASGSTASGSTASIETCDVIEYKFSNNSKPYLSKNLKYVSLSTNVTYKSKKDECKGEEKIVDTIWFTGCPKNLGELDKKVKDYIEMKGCGQEIHQDVYIIGGTNILGSNIDAFKELMKLPMSTVKLNKVYITCANAADFASKYPEAKDLLESTECKKSSTASSTPSVTNYAQSKVRLTLYSSTGICPSLNDLVKNLPQNTSIQLNSSGVSCTPVNLPSVNSGSTSTVTTNTGSITTPSKKTPVQPISYCDDANPNQSDCEIR